MELTNLESIADSERIGQPILPSSLSPPSSAAGCSYAFEVVDLPDKLYKANTATSPETHLPYLILEFLNSRFQVNLLACAGPTSSCIHLPQNVLVQSLFLSLGSLVQAYPFFLIGIVKPSKFRPKAVIPKPISSCRRRIKKWIHGCISPKPSEII